jgi:group I intron endonuclease
MENLYTTTGLNKKYNQSGIYMIQIGSRYYIGSSNHIGKRLLTHKSRLKKNKHENIIMINCFNKYGEEQCHFKVLELCNKDILIKKEKFYIDVLKPELNVELNPIEQNSDYKSKTVYQYTKESVYVQEFTSASNAERFFGKCNSKISQCCLGKRKSAYGYLWSYDKIVDKLVYENNSSKAKAKKVSQYSAAGEFIKTYKSVAEAVRALNKPENASTNISSAALGNTKHAYNYVWKYE